MVIHRTEEERLRHIREQIEEQLASERDKPFCCRENVIAFREHIAVINSRLGSLNQQSV